MIAVIKSFYYFFKGKNLYRLGRYEEALTAFEEAIKFNPTYNIYNYKHKALNQINNLIHISYKKQKSKHTKDENSNELKHKEENKQLAKQLEEMQGQFQTLQKQVSNLSTNSKLKKAVKALKYTKNENLKGKISELQEEIKELKSPIYIKKNNQFFSDQFKGLHDHFTTLQGQVEENKKTVHRDRKESISQMKELQEQMDNIEDNNNITSSQIIKLQGQMDENEKITQNNKSQLRKNTEELKEHGLILQNINAVDKANIKEHITYLKSQEPLLYTYYQTFYWTIFNFFYAHLVLSTDLLTYNTDYTITTKDSHIKSTKTVINGINIFAKHLPAIGSLSEIISDVIDNVYQDKQKQKLQNKTQIISNIVKTKFQNVEELDIALTYSTFLITHNRKDTILQSQLEPDNFEVKPSKCWLPSLKNCKKSINSDNKIKSTDNELIKLALQDTILLIIALYKNHDSIISNNENFSDQVKLILENNPLEELSSAVSSNSTFLEDTYILETIGNVIEITEDIFN